MAAPNIVGVTTINANTAMLLANNVGMNAVISNVAGSNAVIKVNTVLVSNYGANTITTNVDLYRGGVSYPISGNISVPGFSTLISSSKDTAFYLVEGDTLRANTSANNVAAITASYETIS